MITPAHAVACPPGTYPPGQQCIPFSITVTVVVNGQTVTVTVTGFAPFSKVKIVLQPGSVGLGTFTTNGSGAVTATLTVPKGLGAGAYTITASGVDANGAVRILSAPLTVKSAGSGSGLPFTGFELGAASLLGAGLLGAGTIAVASGRKRKSSFATA
jgi:hypothetical protein